MNFLLCVFVHRVGHPRNLLRGLGPDFRHLYFLWATWEQPFFTNSTGQPCFFFRVRDALLPEPLLERRGPVCEETAFELCRLGASLSGLSSDDKLLHRLSFGAPQNWLGTGKEASPRDGARGIGPGGKNHWYVSVEFDEPFPEAQCGRVILAVRVVQ